MNNFKNFDVNVKEMFVECFKPEMKKVVFKDGNEGIICSPYKIEGNYLDIKYQASIGRKHYVFPDVLEVIHFKNEKVDQIVKHFYQDCLNCETETELKNVFDNLKMNLKKASRKEKAVKTTGKEAVVPSSLPDDVIGEEIKPAA